MTVSVPALEPTPATGCDVCAALCRQREEARAVGNGPMARDWNDELRNHPSRRSGDWK